jgi:hypothetical protein
MSLGLHDVYRSETSVTPRITKDGHTADGLSVNADKREGTGNVHPVTGHEDRAVIAVYMITV